MSETEEKNIHNSSLTTSQLKHKASLEQAAKLIRDFKTGDDSQVILDLIQGVIKKQNSV